VGVGMVAVVASVLSMVVVFEKISGSRPILSFPALRLDVSPGVGPWIQVTLRRHPDRWDVGGTDPWETDADGPEEAFYVPRVTRSVSRSALARYRGACGEGASASDGRPRRRGE
jgi:hypothetical protein